MSYILWFLVIISAYQLALLLRAKFALRTLQKENVDFANNDEYQECHRSFAPRRMRKFIDCYAPKVEQSGFRLLKEFIKPKSGMGNYHVVFISSDRSTILELNYQKLSMPTRILLGLCGSSMCFKPEILSIATETNYKNGDAVTAMTIEEVDMPGWIHAAFLPEEKELENVLQAHHGKRKEVELQYKLEPVYINGWPDFVEKEKTQIERLSAINDQEFDSLVTDNNVGWLLDSDDRKNN